MGRAKLRVGDQLPPLLELLFHVRSVNHAARQVVSISGSLPVTVAFLENRWLGAIVAWPRLPRRVIDLPKVDWASNVQSPLGPERVRVRVNAEVFWAVTRTSELSDNVHSPLSIPSLATV